MSQFEELNLSQIKESAGNPRKLWDDNDLQELKESIAQKGVIQPIIVVFANAVGEPSEFEIVCGHRRVRASILAGKETIPALIRTDLAPEEILELQITENLQRADVHPLDEVIAFARLRDERNYSTEDIAKKIGKDAKYVVQRMKLNDLIEEVQKVFYSHKLFLTQAFEISRLVEADQRELYKTFLKDKWQKEDFTPKHVGNIDWWISQTRMDLSKVPWKLDDATLLPKAGPCSRCPKNTACNEMLFPDLDKARCLDRDCYNAKKNAHLDRKIQKLEEQGEEVVLIKDYWQPEPERFTKSGRTILKEIDQFNIVHSPDKKEIASGAVVKALWVSGNDIGHSAYIRIKTNGKVATDNLPIEQQIVAIEQREARNKELDHVKIFKRLYDLMREADYANMPASLRGTEAVAIMYAMCQELPDERVNEWFKLTGNRWDGHFSERLYNAICKKVELSGTDILRTVQRAWILQKLYVRDLSHESSAGNKALYYIGESYYTTELTQFSVEQAAIREKREKRVKERIAVLKQAQDAEKKAKAAPAKTPGKKEKAGSKSKSNLKTGLAALLEDKS